MPELFAYGLTDPPTNTYPGSVVLDARSNSQRKLRFADYVYHFDGTEAAADTIRLPFGGPTGKWPKGTEVFPQLSYAYVETDAMASGTLDVGDDDGSAADAAYANGDDYDVAHIANDADRYADGLDIGAVGVDVFAGGVAAAIPHVLQSDCYLKATFATLSTPSATGVLRLRVAYLADW